MISAILMFASVSVQAADSKGQFAIKGVGNVACKQYIQESKERSHNAFLFAGWINGYLTAQNQHLADTFDVTSWETIHTLANYVGHYCEKNPDKSFYLAVATMLNAMFEKRIVGFSPVAVLGSGEDTLRIYKQTVQRAQQELAKQGMYKGKVDGEYGPEMKGALETYQKKLNLKVSGLPDQATLHHLLR